MSFRRTTDKQFEARIENTVQGSLSTRVDEAIISLRENEAGLDLLEKGWAMKNKRSGVRIPQNSKDYVVAAALKRRKGTGSTSKSWLRKCAKREIKMAVLCSTPENF